MKLSDLLNELEEEESNSTNKEPIDFKLILFKYLSKWHWFALGVFICLSVAVFYVYFSPRYYMVTAKLLLEDENKGADFSSNAVVSDMMGFSSTSSVENQAEVLKSENLMIEVFKELDINNTYSIPNGKFRWKEIYGYEVPIKLVLHQRYDYVEVEDNSIIIHIKNQDVFILETPDGTLNTFSFGQKISNYFGEFSIIKNPDWFGESISANNTQDSDFESIKIEFYYQNALGKHFSENLTVDIVNKLASVVTLYIVDTHPKKGEDILNKLIEVYNREAENEKNQIATNTIEFIDEQLVSLTKELEAIEQEGEQYKVQNSITDVGAESQLYLSSTTVNRQQLSQYSIQIEVLESIESYLQDQGTDYEMVPSTLSIDDPTLTGLIAQFNQLQRERERMLRTTQPNNPIVQNYNQQLTSLRASILENLKNIKNGLVISRDNLQATANQFQSRASKVPTMERKLLDINRKQGLKEEHYIYLIQKREEAVLTLAATTNSNSKVIDPASPSDEPVSPKKNLIYAFSLIMGLGFPFALIFIKDMWQDKIQSKSDVEKITSTKILGEISRNKDKKGGTFAISQSKRTLVAEQFRFIRSNLAFSTYKKPSKVIMVTSGMSGEGKTFFSINLGISLALVDKKVIVLEFDLRKPAMLAAFGINAPIGISDYLGSNKYHLDDLIHPIPSYENLSVIGCGKIPDNPAELMMGVKLIQLIEELSNRYDYVLIDTAPVGLVSDSFILSELADVTIFMVRYNYSTKAQIKTIEDIRKNKKFKFPLIVLNDADLEVTYGYGSTYGKNYYQDQ